METITIKVKSGEEAQFLIDMVRKLDFVTSIETIGSSTTSKLPKGKFSSEKEFLSMCGLWKGRDISAEKIREKAWREIKL